MNLGERFFCSKCMVEIEEEGTCPYCGYDPGEETDNSFLEEGTLLHNGRYQLGAVTGRGGFGITYAAWDLVLEMAVAVKEYFPVGYSFRDICKSDQVETETESALYYQLGLRTFLRESRILASLLNIKSVVEVYDCFEENHTAYIIMEFVRGKKLAEYYKDKKLSARKLMKLLRPTINDLISIHNVGVLHRDISPDNLIVQEDGIVKLIDFGASLKLDREAEKNFCLNRGYAALEQYDPDGKQGGWTDVYGLAATLYTVISGQGITDAVNRLESDTIKPLHKSHVRIRRRLSRAIHKGLAVKVSKRHQSMVEFQEDLYDFKTNPTKTQSFISNLKLVLLMLAVEAVIVVPIKDKDVHMIRQLELAAKALLENDTKSACILGAGYRDGVMGEEMFQSDEKLAVYWYEWAAEHGDTLAMYEYADMLRQGAITKQDIPKAVSFYEQAIENGSPEAMNDLGCLYSEGKYVEQDLSLAYHYFEQAAGAGLPKAIVNVGLMCYKGRGITEDKERAARCFREADEKGEYLGTLYLGICYGRGEGVKQSDILCYKYCYEAAVAGVPEAMCWMGEIYLNGLLGFQDETEAAEWFKKASDTGYAEGEYIYATLLRDGIGVEKDEQEAYSQMCVAAFDGSLKAQKEIRRMRRNGFQIQPHPLPDKSM